VLPAQVWTGEGLPELPGTVGDLVRLELVTGAQAQAEVDRLHGKALAAEASLVARYGVPGEDARPAEVWISRVASEAEARRQTGLMVHKMFENPKSPFGHPRRVGHGDLAVYRFEGMGRIHCIWFSGPLVYWISAAPAREAALLDAVCAAPVR
jgi:hypothetical protein